MKKILKILIKQVLKIFYIFPIKENHVFIISFGGKSTYGFDARALIEYSNNNKLGYIFYWGINENEQAFKGKKNIRYVKIKSIKGLYYMITSEVFITNINPPSFVPFRKKQTLINTWHGVAMKKFGKYDKSYDLKQVNMTNCFISHSKDYTDIALIDSLIFNGDILNCGAPRNDVLFNIDEMNNRKQEVRNMYNIEEKDFVVLYTPTFRGDFNSPNLLLDYGVIAKELKKKYKRNVVFLLRLHPMISRKNTINDKNIIDVTQYEDIQDLYCASDLLITDYSSTSYDFSLTRRPVFIYAFDIDEFEKERGLGELFFNRPYPIARTNEELCSIIRTFKEREYLRELEDYFSRIQVYDRGNACKEIYNYIIERRKKWKEI